MGLPALDPEGSKLSGLFSEWKGINTELFSNFFGGHRFSVRPFDIETDLHTVHKWVNMDYAKRFWQMDGPVEILLKAFSDIKANQHAGSFIGCLDGDTVCQLDAYDPRFDELYGYYQYKAGDIGIHLLLGPDKTKIPNFSAKVVMAFAAWFFGSGEINRIVTEPDKENRASNWLLRRLKFTFLGELSMPEKSANLFCMTKAVFDSRPNEYL